MPRVAGADPGTSSLDLLVLLDGAVEDQHRFPADALNADPTAPAVVVELGSAFTACLVLSEGQIVDGLGGTSGPVGWGGSGAWDGELAYLLSPLAKRDLFAGGAGALGDAGRRWFRESLVKAVAGLRAVTPLRRVVLSGRLLETEPALAAEVEADLRAFGDVTRLPSLPGACVKHAAQGAAL